MAGPAGSGSRQRRRCRPGGTPEGTWRRSSPAWPAVAAGAAALWLIAGAASCSGGPRLGAGSAQPGAGSARAGAGPARAVLYGLDDHFIAGGGYASSELVRLDPLTLRRQRQQGPLLGDHVSLAVSPDHSVLAAGSDDHGDLVLLDLQSMRRIGGVKVGVASDGQGDVQYLGWLGRGRIFAAAVGTGPLAAPQPDYAVAAIVDAARHRVLARRPLPGSPFAYARAGDQAVLLTMPWRGPGAARLSVFGAAGRLRSVRLARIEAFRCCPAGAGPGAYVRQRQPGLAVDPAGDRAFVIGGGEPIAVVDLKTLAVRYHRWPAVTGSPPVTRTFSRQVGNAYAQAGPRRAAAWLGQGRIAVCGEDDLPPHPSQAQAPAQITPVRPAGLEIIDTRRWQARLIAPLADEFAAAGGLVFPLDDQDYGPAVQLGLTGYRPDGQAVLHLLDRRFADGVYGPFGHLAYAGAGPTIAIIDLAGRRVLRLIRVPNPNDQIFPEIGWQTRSGSR